MQSFDPYKSASALGISEQERQGLIGLARDMSDPEYGERFDMVRWGDCLRPKLERRIGRHVSATGSMYRLCRGLAPAWQREGLNGRTPIEAADAIYRFLQKIDHPSNA